MVEMKELTKIKDLTPQHNKVNVLAKVVKLGEVREVPSRYGPPRRVSDTVIGDETGTIVMSLWQEQVGTVTEGDVIYIDNGYISLYRGHMRLNIGKYGALSKSDQQIGEVSTERDMSEKEYPMERRGDRFGERNNWGGRGPRDEERRRPRY
ncbi:MAG: single-stranded DNA-binding protein [Thermoplasmatota archaeon]